MLFLNLIALPIINEIRLFASSLAKALIRIRSRKSFSPIKAKSLPNISSANALEITSTLEKIKHNIITIG